MKSILVLTLSLGCGSAFGAPISFDSSYLIKQNPDNNGDYYLAIDRNLDEWCGDTHHSVAFGSYQAGKDVDAMVNGLYLCQGQFVAAPSQPIVQIFSLSNCRPQDPVALKKTCPPPGP